MSYLSLGTLTIVSSTAIFMSTAAIIGACGASHDQPTDGGIDSSDRGGGSRDSGVASNDAQSDGGASLLDSGDGSSGSDSGWFGAYNPDGGAACPGAEVIEFAHCSKAADCGCALMDCVNDPVLNQGGLALGTVCEYKCTKDSDCLSFDSHCVNGSCAPVLCGGETGNGKYGGTCTVKSSGDGTCMPVKPRGAIEASADIEIGICSQGGTSTTKCASSATPSGVDTSISRDRTNVGPADLCAPGMMCGSAFARGAAWSRCNPTCYPPAPGDPACPSGESCFGIPGDCINVSTDAGPVCVPIRGLCCPSSGCSQP